MKPSQKRPWILLIISLLFNRSGMWVKHIIHMQTITLIPIVMYCKLLITIIKLSPDSEFYIGAMPSVNPFQYISLLFKNTAGNDVDAMNGASGDEAWANPMACPGDATGTDDNSPNKEDKLATGRDGVAGMVRRDSEASGAERVFARYGCIVMKTGAE